MSVQRCNLSRVLIVDDVEIVRKALQVGVQKLGHEAEGASDPRFFFAS